MGGLGTEVVTADQGHDQHGIGTRVVTPGRGGTVESRLQVDPLIARADGFIDAVVHQHDAFIALDHPNLAAARGVERRLVGQRPCLDVISSHPAGEPLGHLLARRARAGVPLSTAAALYLVRELLSIVRALQSHRSGTFHGALSLDAVVITADQRVVVRDVVFGRALSNVTLAPAAWWQQYGLAVPSTPGIPAFTPLTDQFQLGVLALSAFLGRPLGGHDDLLGAGRLLERVSETSIDGEDQPLGLALKGWLSRALLIAPEGPFRSLNAAADALEELLDAEAGYVAAPIGLEVDVPATAVEPDPLPVVVVADPVPAYDPFAMPTPAAPVVAASRSDPFAGHAFIIESNDGRSSAVSSEAGSGYEPLAVVPRVAAPSAAPSMPSVYDAPREPAQDERPAVTEPLTTPPATPLAVALPASSPAPPAMVEAPRPFWEMPAGKATGSAATVLPFPAQPEVPRPPVIIASPAPRPSHDRLAGPVLDLVVDAPPPALGTVTPIDLPQVPTTTSSLLRAAVEEFEQPVEHRPVPPPAPAPMATPAVAPGPPLPRVESHQDATPFAHTSSTNARPQTGQHGVHRDIVPDPPAHRHAPVAYDVDEVTVQPSRRPRFIVVAALLAVVMGGALAAGYMYLWPKDSSASAAGDPGHLRLESKPAGAVVRINGLEKGRTPLTLALPPGGYRIEFERGGEVRTISAAVTTGNETFQVVTLYPPGPPGVLDVATAPKGATVLLNGEPRGQTPIQIDGLAPGEYTITVQNAVARVEQKVEVLPDQTSAVEIPLSGMLDVSSPIPLTISEGDRPLGQLRAGRVAVGVGLRRLRLANDELGFEEVREVEVAAVGVTRVIVTPPSGVLNLTADTETDVYLDGRPIGLTPLTNLSVPLGVHEVTFRHAQWGEQNYTVLVGLTTPSRLHVTMTVKAPKAQARRPAAARRRL